MIPFGTTDFESLTEKVPRFRVRNLYAIENPLSQDARSFVSRPTLSLLEELSEDKCFGMFRQDGCLSGATFAVYGDKLYSAILPASFVEIDDLPGDEYCKFAGTEDRIIIVRNGIAYSYDGAALTTVVIPDDLPIEDVATINGFFILAVQDDQRYYWIAPGETDPDALSFATAERTPDALKSVDVAGDEVWFIGTSSVEVWTPTADADLPFERISGRVYNDGTVGAETVVPVTVRSAPALMWVTPEKAVVLGQGAVQKVSNPVVEERLKTGTNPRAWSFRLNRKDFYVLSCDEFTTVCNLEDFTWAIWDCYGYAGFRGHLGVQAGSRLFAGDVSDGSVWELVAGDSDEGQPVTLEISGFVSNTDAPLPCYRVTARVNVGTTESLTEEPILEMRWSDDLGYNFTEYFPVSLGLAGEHSKEVSWRSLGKIRKPGRIFEFRTVTYSRFRLDYVEMNDV